MIIKLRTGKLATNTYIVCCPKTRLTAIIDPGGNPEAILDKVKSQHCDVKMIINTHGHADHIVANKPLVEELGCKILIHKSDADLLTTSDDIVGRYLGLKGEQPSADLLLNEGDEIEVGSLKFKVIHTPGHTPGSISLYNEADKVLFSGDTLFKGSIGRYDLPGGDFAALKESLKKLLLLPPEVAVYPGHGPMTTLKAEREDNPYCQ